MALAIPGGAVIFPLRGWLRHARKLAYIVFFIIKFIYKYNISELASMALAIPGGGSHPN